MEKSGAQILLECLKNEGVDFIFGYPGGVTLDIYDAMAGFDIKHILVRHEQAAVHAADGFARASGKPGVCLVTSGPGATNTVTGIATAYADSIPMVIFTGQVPVSLIGNDAFQEVDILGITRPCTKHNYMVSDVRELPDIVRKAFYIACSGRPGPVLVDLPRNVLKESMKFVYPKEPVRMRTYNPTVKPNINQLKKAAKTISQSKRPLILAGGGAVMAGASACLTELATKYKIPVISTLMGLGAFDSTSPLNFGMLGMHGLYAANKAVGGCDVLIAVGVRFDDRVTGRVASFASNAKIIHIDIDPTSIRKSVQVSIPIVADCKKTLEELDLMLEAEFARSEDSRAGKNNFAAATSAWLEQLVGWKKECPTNLEQCCSTCASVSGKIKPQKVIEAIYEITKGEAVIATEVGQHQMWVAQFYPFSRPRTLITSGGLGTMGYGFPAAIGAQFALPDSLVIDVAGDGSIQMNIQELGTVASNNLPVKIVILNNHYLGMVRQLQEFFYDSRYAAVNMDVQPDFVKLAEAYGIEGFLVTDEKDLKTTLKKAFASKKAAIIDIHVEREENVYPMVPSGSGLDEMLLS